MAGIDAPWVVKMARADAVARFGTIDSKLQQATRQARDLNKYYHNCHNYHTIELVAEHIAQNIALVNDSFDPQEITQESATT